MSNYNNFNQRFINCLAPSLCGIKLANLFTVSISDFSQEEFIKWKNLLTGQNLGLVNFKSSDTRIMVIAFNFLWIRKILGDFLIQTYLRRKGYEVDDPPSIVRREYSPSIFIAWLPILKPQLESVLSM